MTPKEIYTWMISQQTDLENSKRALGIRQNDLLIISKELQKEKARFHIPEAIIGAVAASGLWTLIAFAHSK